MSFQCDSASLSEHRPLSKWFVPLIHPLLHLSLQHTVPSRGHPVKRGKGAILDPKVRLTILSLSSPLMPRKQLCVHRDSWHRAAQGHILPTVEVAPSGSQPNHHPNSVFLILACPCSWASHAQEQTWSSHSFRWPWTNGPTRTPGAQGTKRRERRERYEHLPFPGEQGLPGGEWRIPRTQAHLCELLENPHGPIFCLVRAFFVFFYPTWTFQITFLLICLSPGEQVYVGRRKRRSVGV